MSHPSVRTRTETLLARLRVEEGLLREALANAADVYAGLRGGDLRRVAAGVPRQEQQADELRAAAAVRAAAAADLAAAVGLPADGLTLADLAARLDGPAAAELLAARDQLRQLSAELISYQQGNANLVGHLRQYFRGVLAGLTAGDGPVRYGPSGSRVDPGTGLAILARG